MAMDVNKEVHMISAVSEALKFRRENPRVNNEQIMQHVSKFANSVKNQTAQIGMVVSASKALSIIEKEPSLTDKEVIKRVMQELPNILDTVGVNHSN